MKKTKVNSINHSDFFKFIISIRGGHCEYSRRASKRTSYVTVWHGCCESCKFYIGFYSTCCLFISRRFNYCNATADTSQLVRGHHFDTRTNYLLLLSRLSSWQLQSKITCTQQWPSQRYGRKLNGVLYNRKSRFSVMGRDFAFRVLIF
jgi:hypothetical protein